MLKAKKRHMPLRPKISRRLAAVAGLTFAAIFATIGYTVILNSRASTALPADVNNDGKVNILDLSAVLAAWGTSSGTADATRDGSVNIFDVSVVLANWGATATTNPTPTNSPAPTPTPAPSGNKLSWAPPAGYQNFPIKNITNTSSFTKVSCGGGDALIKLPRTNAVGPVYISDCRNAVIIGGTIKVLPTSTVDGQDQRAIYIRGGTGTIHIEGVYIEGNVSGSTADAIAVSAPSAIIQLENVNANGMKGSSGNHADVFQPWGGAREYRIDRLTGSSNFQGLHVGEDLGQIGRGTIRNANIFSSGAQSDGSAGQYIWLPDSNQYPVTLENVYISPRSGASLSRSIWPSGGSCGAKISGSPAVAVWSGCSITGKVTEGRPPGGDFVPPSSVGLNYSSPGYQ